MQKKGKLAQLWLVLIGLGLFGLLLFSKRNDLDTTIDTITNAKLRYVLLIPVLQIFSFFVIGKYYQSMLKIFKSSISTMRAWGVSSALSFVNQILPSGGISGLAYLAYGFRKDVSIGTIGLIQLLRYVLSMVSYFILAPLVILMLVITGQTSWFGSVFSKLFDSGSAWLFALSFILIVLVTWKLLHTKSDGHKAAYKIERGVNRLFGLFRRRKDKTLKEGTVKKAFKDFRIGYGFLRSNASQAVKPVGFMLLSTITDLLMVYCAFLAVGAHVGVGILFFSYIAANITGVVSIIPGDVGVHESAMILMLSSLGVENSIAISATVLYRIFNKMIVLPIGFFFYTRLLTPENKQSFIEQ